MTYRFGLYFRASKEGELPHPPRCYLYLKRGPVDDGRHAITPTDMVESDLDYEIDKLIGELKSLKEEAKRKYRASSGR